MAITALLGAAAGVPLGALLWGFPGALGAGLAAGVRQRLRGVGGPMISAYGLAQRWDRTSFVPTAQVVLLAINVTSLLVKGDTAAARRGVGGRRLGPGAGRRLVLRVSTAGGSPRWSAACCRSEVTPRTG